MVYDVSLPPGLRSHPSLPTAHCAEKDGWRVIEAGTRKIWRYTNVSGRLPAPGETPPTCTASARGVFAVIVKDLTKTPRRAFQFIVKTRRDTFPHIPVYPVTRMHAEFALAAQPSPGVASPEAIAGQCAEVRFAGTPLSAAPPKPFCREVRRTFAPRRIACRGP